ncbi:metallophosphoesterase [Actinoplanes sp. N902-109]|uniref:metallophosphoesterase n=1 Tax=Actinoplanes sp. (strain N902-109) TaxID=649831 RepID=UPI0003295791|nr:metallophosphoesterase [Actinoplanes sp. N902-109]
MIGFVGLAVLVVLLIHLYLWKRLVRDPLRKGIARRVGGVVAVVLAVLVPATLIGVRGGHVKWLAWPGYLWLALMFYLLVVLLLLEIPRLVASLALRRRTAEPATDAPDPDRRLLMARGAAIFAGLTAAGVTGYGVKTALGKPRVARMQVPLAKLPRAMDGTRLAVVSDIHLGPLTGIGHTERIVEVINSVNADIVCVVGDLVDGSVAELGRFAAPLAGIRSRRGAYFVTGNHEYYSGYREWIDEVARLNVRPLRNERLELAGLDLAGVNDLGGTDEGDAPDFARALGDRDPARPVVLMAHQPLAARDAAPYGVDLQVSGHTHGGQMAPFNLLVKLQQPVVSGFGEVDGVPVYVTNGAGFWGPPVRVGAPPQVSVLELRTR